jgi:hypothetical protein
MIANESIQSVRWLAWARWVFVAVCLLRCLFALAQPAVSEPALKAAIVFTLAKFTEWPATTQPTDSLFLCVVGAGEPLNAAFSALDSKLVQGRPLRVRTLGAGADVAGCHIVFTSASPGRAVQGRLTVGDAPRFAETGGMVGLATANDRIQLEVNVGVATNAGLKFSSQLLRLARVVSEPAPKTGG